MASDVIERIKKLLALANNAGSEHEAAIAADRASAMMQEHQLTEAQLRVDLPCEPHSIEEIIQAKVTDTRKKVAWHMRVAGVVDELYGCHAFWRGGQIMFFGRISAVQAATYTTQYLLREVETLIDRQFPSSEYSRKYRNGARLGCSQSVRQNIQKLIDKQAARVDPVEIFDDILPAKQPKASDGVLAVIKRDQAEVDENWEDFMYPKYKNGNRRKGRSSNVGNITSHDGYASGRAAGRKIKINVSRGGLPRGQDSLK